MIAPGTQLHVVVVRLSQIVVTETQPRYPERVLHYYRLLSDPAHTEKYAGVAHLAPYGVNRQTHEPLYTLLDGHHRYVASVMAGRETILGLLHIAPDTAPNEEGAARMRTLTEVLCDAKRAERAGTDASALLAETCRILAAVADQDRLPYGERRVAALVEDILATTNVDWARSEALEPIDLLARK